MSSQFNHQALLFRAKSNATENGHSSSFYDKSNVMLVIRFNKIIINLTVYQSTIQIRRHFLRRVCHEKEWWYAKSNRVLKEFDLTQNETEWPNSEFKKGVKTGEAKQLYFKRMEMKLAAYLLNMIEKTYNIVCVYLAWHRRFLASSVKEIQR